MYTRGTRPKFAFDKDNGVSIGEFGSGLESLDRPGRILLTTIVIERFSRGFLV
jgi:hypothetical protein